MEFETEIEGDIVSLPKTWNI